MQVIERTPDPSIASVDPTDLRFGPDPDDVDGELSLSDLGGKDLRVLLVLEDDFARVRPKREIHVVTDDGDVYVWSRFSDDEPWTFDYRRTDGDEHDITSRQLPAVVEAIVDERDLLY